MLILTNKKGKIDRLILSKDDILYSIHLYTENRFSYVFEILIDKNTGRKFYLLESILRIPGTVIKNKRKYLESNSITIQVLIEDGESLFGKYISEYHVLAVLLKSTVVKYRRFSEWLLNEVNPKINKKLLEEDPTSAKFPNTGNSIADRIITQIEEVLNEYKKRRRADK